MRSGRTVRPLYAAWAASFLAYTGFWAYHTAVYGFWYSGPIPVWLNIGLSATLAAAVIFTVAAWRYMKKRHLL